jgi:hypothetical protein
MDLSLQSQSQSPLNQSQSQSPLNQSQSQSPSSQNQSPQNQSNCRRKHRSRKQKRSKIYTDKPLE